MSEFFRKIQVYAGLLGLLIMACSLIMLIRQQAETGQVFLIGAGLFGVFIVLKVVRRLLGAE